MIPLAALPLLGFIVVAPATPVDGCPSAGQVGDALVARVPDSVLPADSAMQRSDVLRVVLDLSPDGTSIRFALVTGSGDTRLKRTLPAPGRGVRGAECLALADTLATIVDRYLHDVEYEAPESQVPESPPGPEAGNPPKTAPPRPSGRALELNAGAAARVAASLPLEIEGRLGAGIDLTGHADPVRKWVLLASIGLGPALSRSVAAGTTSATVTARRFPIDIALVRQFGAGRGALQAGAGATADLFLYSSRVGGQAGNTLHLRPGLNVEGRAAYVLPISGGLLLRADLRLGVVALRQELGVTGVPDPLFQAPWTYITFGISGGWVFR